MHGFSPGAGGDAADPCIMGPSFLRRAARIPGNAHVLRPFPTVWPVLGHPRAGDTWAARGEHHEHPRALAAAHQAPADVVGGREGYRKASNWCPSARNNDAGHGSGRGRDRARALA